MDILHDPPVALQHGERTRIFDSFMGAISTDCDFTLTVKSSYPTITATIQAGQPSIIICREAKGTRCIGIEPMTEVRKRDRKIDVVPSVKSSPTAIPQRGWTSVAVMLKRFLVDLRRHLLKTRKPISIVRKVRFVQPCVIEWRSTNAFRCLPRHSPRSS